MRLAQVFFITGLLFCGLAVALPAAEQATDGSWVYEMKLVQIHDMPGVPTVYVIGFSAFRTAQALKDWVANMHAGDTLKWDPGSDIPLADDPLRSPEAAGDFKKFCGDRKIKLERVVRP